MMRASILLLTLALLGCDERPETHQESDGEPTGPPVATWPATLATSEGGYKVTVNPEGGSILKFQHFTLDVAIEPKSEDEGSVAVKVDADMPAHQHGMNTQPELIEVGALKYRVEGMLFHMSGKWVIMVDVTRDGKTERASFPVQVE